MAQMLALAALAADPDRFHLINVRDAEDYAAAQAGELPADRTPVTICGNCSGRSADGADLLNKLGHPDAVWLEGGRTGWRAQHT